MDLMELFGEDIDLDAEIIVESLDLVNNSIEETNSKMLASRNNAKANKAAFDSYRKSIDKLNKSLETYVNLSAQANKEGQIKFEKVKSPKNNSTNKEAEKSIKDTKGKNAQNLIKQMNLVSKAIGNTNGVLAVLGTTATKATGIVGLLVTAISLMSKAGKSAYDRNMEVNRSLMQMGAASNELKSSTADTANKLIDVKNTWTRIGEDLTQVFEPVFKLVVEFLSVISKAVESVTGSLSDASDQQKKYSTTDSKARWYTKQLEETSGEPESKSLPTIGDIASSAKQSGFSNQSAANLGIGTYDTAMKLAHEYGQEASEVAKKLADAWLKGSDAAKEYGIVVDDQVLAGFMASQGVDIVNTQITDAMKQYYRYQLMQEEASEANSDAMQDQIKKWKQLGMQIDATKNKLFSFDEVINLEAIDTAIPEVGTPNVDFDEYEKKESTDKEPATTVIPSIDTSIKDDITEINELLAGLEDAMAELSQAVESTNTALEALNISVVNSNEAITNNTEAITENTASVDANTESLEINKNAIDSENESIRQTVEELDSVNRSVDETNGKLDESSEKLDTLNQSITDTNTNIEESNQGLLTLIANFTGLNEFILTAITNFTGLGIVLELIETIFETLNIKINETTTEVDTLDQSMITADTDMNTIGNDIETFVEKLNGLKQNVDELTRSVDELNIKQNQTHDEAVSKIDSLKSAIESAIKTVTEYTKSFENLVTQLEKTDTKIDVTQENLIDFSEVVNTSRESLKELTDQVLAAAAGAEELSKKTDKSTKSINENKKAVDSAKKSTDSYNNSIDKTTKSTDNLKGSTDELKSSIDSEHSSITSATSGINSYNSSVQTATSNVISFKAAASGVGGAIQNISTASKNAFDNLVKLGNQIESVTKKTGVEVKGTINVSGTVNTTTNVSSNVKTSSVTGNSELVNKLLSVISGGKVNVSDSSAAKEISSISKLFSGGTKTSTNVSTGVNSSIEDFIFELGDWANSMREMNEAMGDPKNKFQIFWESLATFPAVLLGGALQTGTDWSDIIADSIDKNGFIDGLIEGILRSIAYSWVEDKADVAGTLDYFVNTLLGKILNEPFNTSAFFDAIMSWIKGDSEGKGHNIEWRPQWLQDLDKAGTDIVNTLAKIDSALNPWPTLISKISDILGLIPGGNTGSNAAASTAVGGGLGSSVHFASGGIGTRELNNATLFENNKKEAVIPLETNQGIEYLASALEKAGASQNGGGTNIQLNLTLEGIFDTDDRGKWERLAERIAETIDIQVQRRGGLGYGADY